MVVIAGYEHGGGASRRDLALVLAGTVVFFTLSAAFELSEKVLALTRPWERYQLDELPGVLLFLAAALSWFGWRRVREARVELARRVALEKQLADTLAENRRLSLSHVQVQEEERKQLARELHDELGQHLNAIKIDAVSIRGWSDGTNANVAAAAGDIHAAALAIISVTDHVQNTLRDMLRRLRPAGLDELGLAAALEHLVQQWQARHPQTRATLEVDASVDTQNGLNESINMTCYRLAQEALNNVARHAQARQVRISLQRQSGALVMTVADDGAGAPVPSSAAGLGLVGMRERVEALGGELTLASEPGPGPTPAPGRGFHIKAVIPVAATAEAA